MLRLSRLVLAGIGSAAILASAANAQAGLGQRLDAQEQKLTQDEQTCQPVNLAEYAQLLQEASQNKARADKMAKKGVPVNQAQVDADLAKAMQMFARAQMAHARQCMMQAQQHQAQPPQASVDLSPFAKDVLAAHNAERAAVGSPPLQWNPQLAADATGYAQELAKTRQLTHAPREGRGTERENLLTAPIGWSPDQMMGVWVGEKRYFHPGVFPDVCDGDWSQCAHYTQMIWSTTTDVGCGIAPGGGFDWIVCRYNPGGNKDGKPVISVPTSQPAVSSALSFMVNGMLDFGDDDGISGFVGGGVGVARVDYNNLRAFSNAAAVLDESDAAFVRQVFLGCSPSYCETNVVAPTLPASEVFVPPEIKPGDLDPL